MGIRPTDIQGSIWQSAQNAPLNQRAEEAPRTAQAAAQAAFAAQTSQRNESVAQTGKGEGSRVGPDADGRSRGDAGTREQRRHNAFAAAPDEPGEFDEPPHLIDLRA